MTDFMLSFQGVSILYFVIVTLVGFMIMGIDKHKAKRNRWRIPEKVLMLAAAIGGSIGVLFGMHVWHHKTQKPLFNIGVPIIIVVQLLLLYRFVL